MSILTLKFTFFKKIKIHEVAKVIKIHFNTSYLKKCKNKYTAQNNKILIRIIITLYIINTMSFISYKMLHKSYIL